jgi:hypothetical protein
MKRMLIAVADIPFVLFLLVPGRVPWWPTLAGPLLWLIAFLLTSGVEADDCQYECEPCGEPSVYGDDEFW